MHNCKGFINKDLVLEACKNYPQAVKHILVDINSILRNNYKYDKYPPIANKSIGLLYNKNVKKQKSNKYIICEVLLEFLFNNINYSFHTFTINSFKTFFFHF